jgi:hypothetical protein
MRDLLFMCERPDWGWFAVSPGRDCDFQPDIHSLARMAWLSVERQTDAAGALDGAATRLCF